ncbi:MAG: UDP-3-O-acyl-N-acetylglucosamine deacetylase [Elusimicrobiota bacterium]|jgi:UDP-3-O-acyl N-acetylglucosamine deacetylase|nr:UDP-3-O-acyl-N-acetylglucosamine deacetylase [Elusimicrobiota bacterium]
MIKQTTINSEISVEGIGLHTGNKSIVVFKPAPFANHGIKFIRTDLKNKPVVEAIWSNAAFGLAVRGTVIEKDEVRIHTIEHIMSCAFALGIDNLIVDINNSEPPILDGSARHFAEALSEAGIKEFDILREFYILNEPVIFEAGKTKISAFPSNELAIECSISFSHPQVKFQSKSIKNISQDFYLKELACAKTFCFDYEIEALQSKGLARGGSLENAIVISPNGIHNKEPLRYEDEFVRHKILDLLGDLYLAGKPIKARISADKPGHQNNIRFVKEFLKKAIVEK